jgi:hypothetical protein
MSFFKRHWLAILGILSNLPSIWRGLVWLFDWESRVETFLQKLDQIGGVRGVIEFIANPPPWLALVTLPFGILLIWLDVHRRLRARQEMKLAVTSRHGTAIPRLASQEVNEWRPMFETVAHVAHSIGDADASLCWSRSRNAIRQAAYDQRIRIRGRRQLANRRVTKGGDYSDVQTDIDHDYWSKTEINALATSAEHQTDYHTDPETAYAWGPNGIDERNRYAELKASWPEVLKQWPEAVGTIAAASFEPEPNVSARDAYFQILDNSRWREEQLRITTDTTHLRRDWLAIRLSTEIHRLLRNSRLLSWGEECLQGTVTTPEKPIPPETWDKVEIAFDRNQNFPRTAAYFKGRVSFQKGGMAWVGVKFSREQISSIFPLLENVSLENAAVRLYEAAEEHGFLDFLVNVDDSADKRLENVKHQLIVDERINLSGMRSPSTVPRAIAKGELTNEMFPGAGSTIVNTHSNDVVWHDVSLPMRDLYGVIADFIEHIKQLGRR